MNPGHLNKSIHYILFLPSTSTSRYRVLGVKTRVIEGVKGDKIGKKSQWYEVTKDLQSLGAHETWQTRIQWNKKNHIGDTK